MAGTATTALTTKKDETRTRALFDIRQLYEADRYNPPP
jgi:hypothetical protein